MMPRIIHDTAAVGATQAADDGCSCGVRGGARRAEEAREIGRWWRRLGQGLCTAFQMLRALAMGHQAPVAQAHESFGRNMLAKAL